MSQPPLDELYFTWLYSKVGSVKVANPSKTYWSLLKKLFTKEFVWIVANDDNRAEDGRDLRKEFMEDEGIASVDDDWMRLGCSMLELLIALSRRLEFEAGNTPRYWFWVMMQNLLLDKYSDDVPLPESEIDDILDAVIWRTYADDGTGGLFPVKHFGQPLPEMEIWYQMCLYLIENHGY
jgi:hypothetical protein